MSNSVDVLVVFAANAARIYNVTIPFPTTLTTDDGIVCDVRELDDLSNGNKYYVATYQGSAFTDADLLMFVAASGLTTAWPLMPMQPQPNRVML